MCALAMLSPDAGPGGPDSKHEKWDRGLSPVPLFRVAEERSQASGFWRSTQMSVGSSPGMFGLSVATKGPSEFTR